MKKKYEKPMILIENFSLSTTIAGDCEVQTELQSNNTCGMDFSGIMVFMSGMDKACTGIQVDNVGGDGDFNGICLDRGGMIGTSKNRVFDILVNSNEEAYQYGISNITYNVIRNGY